jgi:hypothetical protein
MVLPTPNPAKDKTSTCSLVGFQFSVFSFQMLVDWEQVRGLLGVDVEQAEWGTIAWIMRTSGATTRQESPATHPGLLSIPPTQRSPATVSGS